MNTVYIVSPKDSMEAPFTVRTMDGVIEVLFKRYPDATLTVHTVQHIIVTKLKRNSVGGTTVTPSPEEDKTIETYIVVKQPHSIPPLTFDIKSIAQYD